MIDLNIPIIKRHRDEHLNGSTKSNIIDPPIVKDAHGRKDQIMVEKDYFDTQMNKEQIHVKNDTHHNQEDLFQLFGSEMQKRLIESQQAIDENLFHVMESVRGTGEYFKYLKELLLNENQVTMEQINTLEEQLFDLIENQDNDKSTTSGNSKSMLQKTINNIYKELE